MRIALCVAAMILMVLSGSACSSSSSAQGPRAVTETNLSLEGVGGPVVLGNGLILFEGFEEWATGYPPDIWVTDSALSAPELLLENALTSFNLVWQGQALVFVYPAADEFELWLTDGTVQGTRFVYAFEPGPLSFSMGSSPVVDGNRLLIFGYVVDYTGPQAVYLGSKLLSIDLE